MTRCARFEIAGRGVGEGEPVLVVAELSANHAGRLDVALRTVEAARAAGADAIKLQTYTPDTLTLDVKSGPFVVRTRNAWAGRTLHDLYAEAMTPWAWHAELKACAESLGLLFFSTPFDPTAAEMLDALGVAAYKIASFELVDLPLVEHVARRGKPMILSTGMASLEEIRRAVETCRQAGNADICLLKCVSSYPARPETMNLAGIRALGDLGVVAGLSDHSEDEAVALAAVALGAKVIEKHFILDRALGGPDAFFSLEPEAFRRMVERVRTTERALGVATFGPGPDEQASLAFRRSLFVARDLVEGEIITCDHVRSVRPSDGLGPERLFEILGRRARRSAPLGTPVTWDLVGPLADPPPLTTRPATQADAGLLFAWRSDPVTRRMSSETGPLEPMAHEAWLARSLAEGQRTLEIALAPTGEPVGLMRLDRVPAQPGTLEVGLSVAPAMRGKGWSHAILARAAVAARALGATRVIARIRAENAASLHAFRVAGYAAFVERTEARGRFVCCERRLEVYP